MKAKLAVIGLKGLPAYGGAAAVGENLIEHMRDQYDITVYATESHTNLKTGTYKGIQQIVMKRIKNKKLNTLLYYTKSALHACQCNYDIVHLHHRDAAFILPILRLRGFKTITTLHGTRLTEKWAKYALFFYIQDWILTRFSHKITSVSPIHYSKIIQNTKKNIRHIPNGITPTNEHDINHPVEFKDYIVFAAGRIVPSKGCHTFLEAAQKIGFKKPILIIGDTDQMPEYKKRLLELSEGLNVSFIGLIKDKLELFSYFKNADLFVYPSIIEAMSMVLLEVASTKTPILCSDIPENKHIFNNDQINFFEADNALDLSKELQRCLEDPKTCKEKANKAYEFLLQNYSWDRISKDYLSEFQDF